MTQLWMCTTSCTNRAAAKPACCQPHQRGMQRLGSTSTCTSRAAIRPACYAVCNREGVLWATRAWHVVHEVDCVVHQQGRCQASMLRHGQPEGVVRGAPAWHVALGVDCIVHKQGGQQVCRSRPGQQRPPAVRRAEARCKLHHCLSSGGHHSVGSGPGEHNMAQLARPATSNGRRSVVGAHWRVILQIGLAMQPVCICCGAASLGTPTCSPGPACQCTLHMSARPATTCLPQPPAGPPSFF
jgi:hypothetical protein